MALFSLLVLDHKNYSMKKVFITTILSSLCLFCLSLSGLAQKSSTTVATIKPPIRMPAIAATITAQAGTKYFNAKHKAKAWLSITPGKGLTLNFETDAAVISAVIESTDTAPYHNGSGSKQTTDFSNGAVKKFSFYLDSPAYKGHKAYILSLITPDVQADAGMYWGCLVVRK